MEYNPGESWDEVNECYPSDIDEEKAFSEFKYGAVFDEEEFEEREDHDFFQGVNNRDFDQLERLYENEDLDDQDIFLGNNPINEASSKYKFGNPYADQISNGSNRHLYNTNKNYTNKINKSNNNKHDKKYNVNSLKDLQLPQNQEDLDFLLFNSNNGKTLEENLLIKNSSGINNNNKSNEINSINININNQKQVNSGNANNKNNQSINNQAFKDVRDLDHKNYNFYNAKIINLKDNKSKDSNTINSNTNDNLLNNNNNISNLNKEFGQTPNKNENNKILISVETKQNNYKKYNLEEKEDKESINYNNNNNNCCKNAFLPYNEKIDLNKDFKLDNISTNDNFNSNINSEFKAKIDLYSNSENKIELKDQKVTNENQVSPIKIDLSALKNVTFNKSAKPYFKKSVV